MDLKSFLKENNSLPENRRVCISPCFRDGDGAEISLCRGFPRERTGAFYGGGNAAADGMAEQANAFFGGGKQRATENRTAGKKTALDGTEGRRDRTDRNGAGVFLG